MDSKHRETVLAYHTHRQHGARDSSDAYTSSHMTYRGMSVFLQDRREHRNGLDSTFLDTTYFDKA